MKQAKTGEFLRDTQSERVSLGTTSRLTLKQRLMILSRMDRMGKVRPTPARVLILLAVLLATTLVINFFHTRNIRNTHANPTPKTDTQVQLSFVGDVCMGRFVPKYAEARGYDELFDQSRELWGNSDLVFANLECVILDEPEKYEKLPKTITLPAPSETLYAVQRNGINVLSVANNHAIDYGGEGLAYELNKLASIGMNYAGAGGNIEEATTAKIIACGDLKIGFLAFSDQPMEGLYSNSTTVATSAYTNLYRNVRETADQTDLMVVYAHWGQENSLNITPYQKALAHRLVESGADIVIGSHPHVLQTVETYHDGIIFYSLGNYLFDQGNRENKSSAMVQLNLDQESGEGEFILTPIRINDFTPQETHTSFYVNEIHRLLTKNLDSGEYYISDDARIHVPMNFTLYVEPEPIPAVTAPVLTETEPTVPVNPYEKFNPFVIEGVSERSSIHEIHLYIMKRYNEDGKLKRYRKYISITADRDYYIRDDGSIYLEEEFLDTLEPGTYSLNVICDQGTVFNSFKIPR